jgi:hypothetical protein
VVRPNLPSDELADLLSGGPDRYGDVDQPERAPVDAREQPVCCGLDLMPVARATAPQARPGEGDGAREQAAEAREILTCGKWTP